MNAYKIMKKVYFPFSLEEEGAETQPKRIRGAGAERINT
jgi:hypothetical protein